MRKFEANKFFVSSDFHLSHFNVLTYDNRPFKDVEEMNQTIIGNLNNLVGEDDHFFFLGDFAFCNRENIHSLLKQIKCKNLYMILGNHDRHIRKDNELQKYFKWCENLEEIWVREEDGKLQQIILCHYAMATWPNQHRDAWHLFGHSHHSRSNDGLSIDVGCNGWDYKPLSYFQIKEVMKSKKKELLSKIGNNNNGSAFIKFRLYKQI